MENKENRDASFIDIKPTSVQRNRKSFGELSNRSTYFETPKLTSSVLSTSFYKSKCTNDSITNTNLRSENYVGDRFMPLRSLQKNIFGNNGELVKICDYYDDESALNVGDMVDHTFFSCKRLVKTSYMMKSPDIQTKWKNVINNANKNKYRSRKISNYSSKTFDAPNLVQDNRYHNVIDWSSDNSIAVCLNNQIFKMDCNDQSTEIVYEIDDDFFTCLLWISFSREINVNGTTESPQTRLLYGTNQGYSALLSKYNDSYRIDRIYSLNSGVGVSALAYLRSKISIGYDDGNIQHFDVNGRLLMKIEGLHEKGGILSMKWSSRNSRLSHLAVLSHDSISLHKYGSLCSRRLVLDDVDFTALDWIKPSSSSETSHLVVASATCLSVLDVSIEAVLLRILPISNPISQIYCSTLHPEILLASYPTIPTPELHPCLSIIHNKHINMHLHSLYDHQAPIIHLCVSPDLQTVCTIAADETIRLWNCFRL